VREAQRQLLAAPGNSLGRDDTVTAAGLDRLFHARERVLRQELQHADKLSGARH